MTLYELAGPEGTFLVEAVRVDGGFQITVGGTTFLLRLQRTEDLSALVAQLGDKPLNVTLEAATSQRVEFMIEGERLSFQKPMGEVGPPQASGVPHQASKDILASPMPGRVVGIMAKAGDKVKEGDPVVVIESMKMQTAVRSDRSASIEAVLVPEGSTVKRGQALVRFGA